MNVNPQPVATNANDEHLKLLAIFHYVLGGIGYLASLFPLIYVVLGVVMATGNMKGGKGEAPPAAVGWAFVGFGLLGTLAGIAISSVFIYAGKSITARKRWMFVFVTAVVMCVMCSPLGTVLGVFTIIVLLRPPVKVAFGQPL